MDAHGDTAVMHNDLPHSFYPSAFHSGGVITPDIGLDYFPSADWYTQCSFNTPIQQPSWQAGANHGMQAAVFDYPLQYPQVEPVNRPASPPISPRTTHFAQLPGSSAITVPDVRLKRKASPDSISSNEYKKGKFGQDYATLTNDSSPQSSTCSPPPVLSTRAHYAVEKRYRSTLNERYATLARIVTQTETMEICRTEVPDWEVPMKLEVPEEGAEKHPGKRQSKTTTLSVAIEAIELLDRACVRKAREYQELSQRLSAIAGSVSMNSECKEQ